jgi:phospholipid/cholesterol/gamma-HCH transport system substrate-binding protein
MIKYKKEFFVGLFFILTVISLLFLISSISGYNIYKNDEFYKLKASFANIGNLKEKSKVTIGGVKIGFVNSISLKKNDNDEYRPEIEMLINKKIDRISVDSSVNILISNLLGECYIQIDIGNDDEFLKNGDNFIFSNQALIIDELISKFAFGK